ncbi:hypothetical protein PHYC_01100 [Phycisphaerales bacterium]|nr:hypothetical protein PHYC_01100 [Phycisphaerales bacterium]
MPLTLANGPLAPTWLVMPLSALTLLVVAGHLLLLLRADMPPSRRRIRTASGLLMMFTLPIGAFALALADPVLNQRAFALSWMLTAGLVTLILALAMLDMLNTWRLHRVELRELREHLRQSRDLARGTNIPVRDPSMPSPPS